MDPFVADIITTLIGCVTGVTVLGIFVGAWNRRRAGGRLTSDQVERLVESLEHVPATLEDVRDALDDLRAQVGHHSEDVRELSGRVEFAERILGRLKSPEEQ